MMFNILMFSLISAIGFYPPFLAPPGGIGSQTPSGGVRAFSMGGVSAGVPDSGMVSILNPSASAWASNTGFSFGTKVRDTSDPVWSNASSFPDVSLIMPLPLGVQLSALLSGRSRLNCQDTFDYDNGTGTIEWSGATAESYLGVTVKASNNLAFSMGGRCFFGSASGYAATFPESSGPYVPVSSEYKDDISFNSAWGMNMGAFLNSGPFAAGFSITTDRTGEASIARDYVGDQSADTTMRYSVPGELTCGVSARIHPRILIGVDYYARKALTILENTTDRGSIISTGFEIRPGLGFRVRGGYSTMDGLWRDGSNRYSGGLGYDISDGKASIDVGAGWETWGSDQTETVVFLGIRASENWLGE
jgi:hypothetical protein